MQKFRKTLQGPFAKTVIVILLVPFALLGYNAFTQNTAVPVPLEIDGREVTSGELNFLGGQLAVRRGMEAPTQAQIDALQPEVVSTLIRREALYRVSHDWGWGESQERLASFFATQPDLLDAQGRFQPELFRARAAAAGLTGELMADIVQRELAVEDWGRVLASSMLVGDAELGRIGRLMDHRRHLLYHEVLPQDIGLADVAEALSEERRRQWYERNLDRYQEPEMASLRFLSFAPDQVPVPADAVTDRELEQAWEEFLEQQPAGLLSVSHIELAAGDEDLARSLAQRIRAGEDFAALAREHSIDDFSAPEGGYLGLSEGDAFPDELEAALDELAPGEVSAPVRAGDSLHLLRLDSKGDVSLPQRGPWLAQERQRRRQAAQRAAAREFRADLEERAWNALDIDELASHYGQETRTSPMRPAPYDPVLRDPPPLHELQSEGVHGPYESLLGNLVVVQLAEGRAARALPYEEASPRVAEEILESARWEKMLDFKDRWLAAMEESGDMAAALQAAGVPGEAVAYSDVSISSVVLPRAALDRLFGLPLPGQGRSNWTAAEVREGGGEPRMAFMQITGAAPGALPPQLAARDTFRTAVALGRAQSLLATLAEDGTENLEVEENLPAFLSE